MIGLRYLTARLPSIFGSESADPETTLRELFNERESSLDMTATFGRPYPNLIDKPTVVFPFEVRTLGGEVYDNGKREFPLPDNGTDDSDSALVTFVASVTNVDTDSVGMDDVFDVAGTTVDATLTNDGTLAVNE